MVTESIFGQLKGEWQLFYRNSAVNQHSFKVNVSACFVLHNVCIEKLFSINLKLDLPCDQNGNTTKSLEELMRILKMVSSKCYVDTSKNAAIPRNYICDYLWNKKEL